MFAFVGAHLGRQFEFVQSEWINDGDFLGLGDAKDPDRRLARRGRRLLHPAPADPHGACRACRGSSSRAAASTASCPDCARCAGSRSLDDMTTRATTEVAVIGGGPAGVGRQNLAPRASQTWTTFLRNHRDFIAAMDFFSVPTVTFRVLQVLLVIRHGRRDVARCAVTTIPTAAWVAQQLREAFPFDSAPRFMIFDRGAIFSAGVTATLRSLQMEPTRTSYRSPWQNGVAERFVATVRQELLDHVIVLNERHLDRLLESFIDYYHHDRTHLGLDKDTSLGRPVEPRPATPATVLGLPRVGGLHRRYAWRRAA